MTLSEPKYLPQQLIAMAHHLLMAKETMPNSYEIFVMQMAMKIDRPRFEVELMIVCFSKGDFR